MQLLLTLFIITLKKSYFETVEDIGKQQFLLEQQREEELRQQQLLLEKQREEKLRQQGKT